MLDRLITGAEVFDGGGGPPRRCSVGIKNGRIAHVGETPGPVASLEVIKADGLWLSPGFIDSHASTGLGYFFHHAADHKLFQGVTTELIGNCGTSVGPVLPRLVDTMQDQSRRIGFPFKWRSLSEYFSRVKGRGLPINLGTLAGHSTLRGGVLEDWKSLKEPELEQMVTALQGALSEGAFGLSSGLIYPPGCYAETDELVALTRVVARASGIYASHVRNERQHLEEAVEEALEIGRAARVPVLVSHLKAGERPNWGKVPKVIRRIEEYRKSEGLAATFDIYPYRATSTKIRAFLPYDLLQDGIEAVPAKLLQDRWRVRCKEWLRGRHTDLDAMVVISRDVPGTAGSSIGQIAREEGREPEETLCDLVRQNPESWMFYHCISEEDLDAGITWHDSIICSDSWSYPINAPKQVGTPHPRTYGAFSRFLRSYVFDRPRMSYGDAVRKMTSLPADFIGIKNRGRIREGYYADLLLMDPEKFEDRATYSQPRRLARGVAHLWINGKPTIREGELFNDKCGRVLRRGIG